MLQGRIAVCIPIQCNINVKMLTGKTLVRNCKSFRVIYFTRYFGQPTFFFDNYLSHFDQFKHYGTGEKLLFQVRI